jgi:predicted O-methyltransferase YrrM
MKAALVRIARSILDPSRWMNAISDPQEAMDKIRYQFYLDSLDWEEEIELAPYKLSKLFQVSESTVEKYLEEVEKNQDFYDIYDRRKREIQNGDAISGTTGKRAAQTMYLVCRIIKPETVVITGTLYGAFDAHITAALHENGKGVLHSIDLPIKKGEFDHGYLIPESFRDHWELHLGDSKDILPDLLDNLDGIDIFLHDSLHTQSHMLWEYETAYPSISDGGVLATHDVQKNNMFAGFAKRNGLDWINIGPNGIAKVTKS